MHEKRKIKIIKRGGESRVEKSPVKPERTKREAARDMVANVSKWVSEVQSRKSSEAKLAFEKLFIQVPTPSES